MSVTFSIEQERTSWVHQCGCGKTTSAETFASYVDGIAALATAVACEDEFCAIYKPFVIGEPTEADALEINVSNVNARLLLGSLGYAVDDDLYGEAAGSDLLGRVLLAQALTPADAGVPPVRQGNVTDCGRHEGYLDERFAQLRALAQWAADNAATVRWG